MLITRIGKKHKYIVYSIVYLAFFAWAAPALSAGEWGSIMLVLLFALPIIGTFFTQYPGINYRNAFALTLLPVHLVLGSAFALIFFPNMSTPFRMVSLSLAAVILYLVSLVNNIFIVVEEKQGTIPLYKVAVTWSQILLVIVAIPFLAGVFKLPVNTFVQNGIAAFSSVLFTYYLLWTTIYDPDVKNIGVGESAMISLLISFFVFSLGTAISFVPTESFLRALFISAVLMFGLSYIRAHYKNTINRSLVTEYGLIFIVFLLLVLTFKP